MSAFLENIVKPYFLAQVTKGGNFILYDLDGKVILASRSVLDHLNYQSQGEIAGKSIADFGHIKQEMIAALKKLFCQAINERRTIAFIGIGGQVNPEYKNFHELVFQAYEPILDENNNPVAILARKIPTIDQNLIYIFFPELKVKQNVDIRKIEELTNREFEILYLLANGLSQYEIANKLKISRSTVLKTISDRIINKLGIYSNDSQEIIKRAIELGIHGKIPRSLVKDQIKVV